MYALLFMFFVGISVILVGLGLVLGVSRLADKQKRAKRRLAAYGVHVLGSAIMLTSLILQLRILDKESVLPVGVSSALIVVLVSIPIPKVVGAIKVLRARNVSK